MDIDPADSQAVQMLLFEKPERLLVPGQRGLRQRDKKIQDLSPVPQVPAGQLPQDEWMPQNLFVTEQGTKPVVSPAEMIDPNGGIDQDHAAFRLLLRGGRTRFLSVPPRSARRRALSRAISASRPIRTRAVFSAIPVRREAFPISASSIFSVVLICMNMHYSCIQVNRWRKFLSIAPGSPSGGMRSPHLLRVVGLPFIDTTKHQPNVNVSNRVRRTRFRQAWELAGRMPSSFKLESEGERSASAAGHQSGHRRTPLCAGPGRGLGVARKTMAEGVGFEPTWRLAPPSRFRVDPVTATSVPLRAQERYYIGNTATEKQRQP